MICSRTWIKRRRTGKPRRGPARDKSYLIWIRTLPCVCCGVRGAEAAHTGPRGLGQKASDYQAIPVCASHHRTGLWAYHGLSPVIWAAHWELDIPAIIAKLNAEYGLEKAA